MPCQEDVLRFIRIAALIFKLCSIYKVFTQVHTAALLPSINVSPVLTGGLTVWDPQIITKLLKGSNSVYPIGNRVLNFISKFV